MRSARTRQTTILGTLFALLGSGASALTAADMTYQGRLTESGDPVNGPRQFVFSIRDSGGELWNSGTQTLTVTDGLYAVVLTGIDRGVLESQGLKLRVAVQGTTLSPDVSIVPAMQAAVAFGVAPGVVADAGLSATGVTAGTYTGVTVNDKGRVIAGSNPATLAGYGISDAVAKGAGGPETISGGGLNLSDHAGPGQATLTRRRHMAAKEL